MSAVADRTTYALSAIQSQLWALAQTGAAGSLAYNISLNLRFRGPLNRALLREAAQDLWNRHDALRTTIAADGSGQTVHSTIKVDARLVDLRSVPAGQREAALQERIAKSNDEPFDLARESAYRLRVYQLADDEHLLMMTAHHILSDGWTLSLLLQELAELYASRYTGGLPDLVEPMQFGDFLSQEAERERAGHHARAERYWQERLQAPLPLTELPLDFQRPRLRTFRAGRAHAVLGAGYLPRLRGLARQCGATLFMLLFAGFSAQLHRICRQDRLLIGTPSAGRLIDGSDTLAGYCGSLLPIRSEYAADTGFLEHVRRIKAILLEAYDHQEFSFAKLIESLPLERSGNRAALIDAIFNLELPIPMPAIPGVQLKVETQATPYTSYDVFLNVAEIDGELSLDLDYNLDVFRPETAEALLSSYRALLDHALAEPGAPVPMLDLLGDEGRSARARFNATTRDREDLATLHAAIERNAERTPDAVALVVDGAHMSYAALNARANRLAHHLLARGARPEDRIGLCVDRSLDQFVGLLAILKIGAAYLPLDPQYPADRLSYAAVHAGISLLLAHRAHRPLIDIDDARVVLLDDAASFSSTLDHNPDCSAERESLAYIIYTSGSTGRPKGVAIAHDSVLNLMEAMRERPGFCRDDRLLAITTYAFDMSVVELFLPLTTGATLVIAPSGSVLEGRNFYEQLLDQHVDVMQATPSAWRLLLTGSWRGPLPIRMLCGGEAMSDALSGELLRQCGELWNMYGPTETTVWSSCHRCLPDDTAASVSGNRPVGTPLANTSFHILDANLQPVPIGVQGTLYIGGDGLARGYWNQPDLTAERFVPDPFSAEPGARLYDTGDLARYLPDGAVDFIGRADNQVKVRGFRIELGEIEAALLRHAGVRQAAVIAVRDRRGDNRLQGFVQAGGDVDRATLRAHLKQLLPHYMVPASMVVMRELPLTPTGKIDRRALASLDVVAPAEEQTYVPPRTALEARVCEEWASLLGVPKVGISDDFFALGGHSLLAAQLTVRLRETLGVPVGLGMLLAHPTVEGLMQGMSAQRDDASVEVDLPPLTPDPAARHEPFPMTPIQEAYWIGRAAGMELGNTPAFNYSEARLEACNPALVERAWNRLVRRHDMLRMRVAEDGSQYIEPEGPIVRVPFVDFSVLEAHDRERALEAVREEMTGHGPLDAIWSDIRISKLAEDHYVLHLYMDMMVFDGASLLIVYRELAALIARPDDELPALEMTFRDYVLAENALQTTPAHERARRYWTERLDTLPPAPDLPLACAPSSIVNPGFVRRSGEIPSEKWLALKEAAKRHGITPSTLALAAFNEVVGSWARQPRFTINLTLFNRLALHPQVNQVVGDFTSLNLLEVDLGASSFVDRARAAQHQLWSDLDHRQFGGVQVIRELLRRRGSGPSAIMPVVFTSDLSIAQHAPQSPLERRIADQRVGISHTPQIWLDMAVMESDGALLVALDAVEALFPSGVLDALFASYTGLLERLSSSDSAWTSRRPVGLPEAQQAVRTQVNATQAAWSEDLLHAGFLAQAERTPDALAVWSRERNLSYGELLRLSRYYGHQLRASGVRPNELVGVVMHKGWEQTVAVLSVLESGAAYLPIDAGLPMARIEQLLRLGEVSRVLTQPGPEEALSWPSSLLRWVVDARALESGEPLPALSPVQDATTLAYVIFTSGSTGEPKGVVIDHQGARNTIDSINALFAVDARDRTLALSSLSFDLSVYDIFGLLTVGGAVVVPDPGLEKDPAHWSALLEQAGVSVWNTVPALMQLLVEYHEQQGNRPLPGTLREVMMSGDWIPVGLPDRIRALSPGVRVTSLGGATEASIWSIYYPIEVVRPEWTSIPYGRPLANQTYHVLRGDLTDCPDWVAGDLYIGGIGLAQGYWRSPEKTASSFIVHPESGERLYRTGDLGRYLPDGDIEFLGREDSQVKIQGFRVELGEIEAALLRQPGVRESVVIASGEAGRHKRLLGYVVLEGESRREPGSEEVIRDPVERALFKLGRPGDRTLDVAGVSLSALPESLGQSWQRLPWNADAPTLESLGGWLCALAARPVEGAPLPKYYYPSSGSLNPIQAYLEVGEGAVAGLSAGTYYYDPVGHRLQALGAVGVVPDGVRLHLVAEQGAVRPLYGRPGDVLCDVEAGYVAELLGLTAPVHGVSLRTAEMDATLSSRLSLGASQRPVLSLEVGSGRAQSADLSLGRVERQSYRRYARRALTQTQWQTLVSGLGAASGVRWYAYVRGQGVEGLPAGYYRIDAETGASTRLAADASEPERRYGGGSAATFAQSAVALYAAGLPTAESRVASGAQSQRAMTAGVKAGVGVCPIGGFNPAGIAEQLELSAGEEVVHSLLAGAIDVEQTLEWEQEPAPQPVVERLRSSLSESLPAYMVPSALMVLERIPLTSNGKVDRRALPQPEEGAGPARAYAAPRTDLERSLAEIWREVLGVERVGVDDHFFEIGGDSLMLIRMRMRMANSLQRTIDIVDLFKYPTIEAFAAYLERGDQSAETRRERARQQAGRQVEAARRARAARSRSQEDKA